MSTATNDNNHAKKGTRPATMAFIDESGRKCLRVPLDPHGKACAVVLERDYERVKRAGAIGPWYLNDNGKGQRYVRTAVPVGTGKFTLVMVARLIIGAGPRVAIHYRNKDRLDLRPENFYWGRSGRAKRNDVSAAERGARYRQQRREERAAEQGLAA